MIDDVYILKLLKSADDVNGEDGIKAIDIILGQLKSIDDSGSKKILSQAQLAIMGEKD